MSKNNKLQIAHIKLFNISGRVMKSGFIRKSIYDIINHFIKFQILYQLHLSN